RFSRRHIGEGTGLSRDRSGRTLMMQFAKKAILATASAATGWKVSSVDLDPQGNASTGIGVASHERERSSYDSSIDQATVAECSMPTRIPGLDSVPATVDLSGAEVESVSVEDRTGKLRGALSQGGAGHDV
ncbi:hypothetical protein OY671_009966, partial [Metschnikowia pulcherrima]